MGNWKECQGYVIKTEARSHAQRDPGVCAIDALSMLTSFDYFFLLLLRTTTRTRRGTVTGDEDDDDVARLLSLSLSVVQT